MDIQIPQIVFQIINFSVVLGALSYLLYKPFTKMLEERAKRVAEAEKMVANTKQEAEALEKKQAELEAKARVEADKLLEEAREQAKKQKQTLIAEAKKQAEKEVKKAREAWEKKRSQEETQMRKEFVSSVIQVAEKIIGKLDKKTKDGIVKKELDVVLKALS